MSDVLPDGAGITSWTAAMIDLSDVLMDHLWLVIAVVIATSLLLLLLAFRSVVVPVKAAVVNLLSVGAAYGVMTLAFQTEAGAELLGLPGRGADPGLRAAADVRGAVRTVHGLRGLPAQQRARGIPAHR